MRPRLEHAANTAAGLLLSCLLLTGCAPTPSSARPLERPSLTPGAEAPADPAAELPLAAYRHDLSGLRLVDRARNTLAAECMARLGYPDWRPPEPPAERPWESGMAVGLIDAGHAAAHGYRAPAERRATESAAPEDERLAYLGPLPGEPAAEGVPEGGCAAEADRLFGPPPDTSPVASIAASAEEAVAGDPRAVEALSAWSACMSARGHEYASPAEAQYQYWPRTATRVEKELAVADVACKQETGLAGVWFTLLGGYQAELIARDRARLDEVAAALAAERERAQTVLEEAG